MPPRKFLKIKPSKGESESILAVFQLENNGISVYYYMIQILLFH